MASGICYIMTNRPRGVLYVGVTADIIEDSRVEHGHDEWGVFVNSLILHGSSLAVMRKPRPPILIMRGLDPRILLHPEHFTP